MTLTMEEVVREREVARTELNRVKAKQARVREDNDRQRQRIEVLNAREYAAIRALLDQCDNCDRPAHVLIQKRGTGTHAYLRMCFEHAANFWRLRFADERASESYDHWTEQRDSDEQAHRDMLNAEHEERAND